MILRRDVNIVHVQQNAAVGALHHFVQKFPFGHFGNVKFGVAAHVFDGHRNFQEIAHFANFLRGDSRRFKGVRHGQQIVRVAAIHAAPAEMIGEPGSLGALAPIPSAAADARDSASPPSRNTWRRRAAPLCTAPEFDRGCCSGRPPSIMKFSEMISNQSTTGLRVRMWW